MPLSTSFASARPIPRARRAHGLSLLAALAVAFLLLLPAPSAPPGWLADQLPEALSSRLDKVVHIGLFFTLAGIWLRSFRRLPGWPRPIASAVLFAACYGGLLELAQALTPERTSSWADALANLIGALLLGAVAGAAGRRDRTSGRSSGCRTENLAHRIRERP